MHQNNLRDGLAALQLVIRVSWKRNLTAWVYVPIGIMIMLLFCFGVDSLISLSSISFPASVACMIILFFALVLFDFVLGDRKTKAIVGLVDIPAGFCLRYINIFFTPSFVLLPLSPPIGGAEVGKIIAVFILGYVLVFAFTAYLVRLLQVLLGSSKRANTERSEEMGTEPDSIPLAEPTSPQQTSEISPSQSILTPDEIISTPSLPKTPSKAQVSIAMTEEQSKEMTGELSEIPLQQTLPPQAPAPLTRPQTWAAFVNQHFDRITWMILFLFIGLPIYYGTGYAMPAQLTINVLSYFFAIALPAKWRRFLHPVLVSSLITVLTIWILGLIRWDNLHQVLDAYKTDSKYIKLFHKGSYPKPGAADLFGSVLDASIVALALPMFQYRKELFQHFFAIVIPNVTISIASLFGYPALSYAIGISSTRSLAFSARSLTLALATPAVKNLGGDLNTVAALAITSGIAGALIGPKLLKWLRIPENDYVTRGVTLGGNSSAIATALLLATDPRAAALSSLSMALFGLITVAFTSVPPIVRAVHGLVGLGV